MSDVFNSATIQIEESKSMLRTAWMAYDRAGRVVQCGVFGMGTRNESEAIVARIVCGSEVYPVILAACLEAMP